MQSTYCNAGPPLSNWTRAISLTAELHGALWDSSTVVVASVGPRSGHTEDHSHFHGLSHRQQSVGEHYNKARAGKFLAPFVICRV